MCIICLSICLPVSMSMTIVVGAVNNFILIILTNFPSYCNSTTYENEKENVIGILFEIQRQIANKPIFYTNSP